MFKNIINLLTSKAFKGKSIAPTVSNKVDSNENENNSIDRFFSNNFKSQQSYVIENKQSDFKKLISLNQGTAAICNQINSSTIGTTEFKLYAVQGSSSKKMADWVKTKNISKKQIEFIKETSTNKKVKKALNIIEIEEHPIFDLLKNTNPYYNGTDLISLTESYLGTIGNCFWYLEKDNNEIKNIWCLLSEYVTIKVENNTISKYIYEPSGVKYFYDPEDIIHFKNLTPGDTLFGRGSLINCYLEATLEKYISLYEISLSQNNARPDYIMSYLGKLDEKDQKELNKMLNSKHNGVNNSGKVMVTDERFDLIPLGFAPKDMAYTEARNQINKRIAKSYGVPQSILEIESSNKASAEVGLVYYNKFTIIPKLIKFCEKLNETLIPMFDDNMYIWFENPIKEDIEIKQKEKEFELRLEEHDLRNGIRTIEEIKQDRLERKNK